jgi:hypothetical protein
MPLQRGKSAKAIANNIRELAHATVRSRRFAVAMRTAHRPKKPIITHRRKV